MSVFFRSPDFFRYIFLDVCNCGLRRTSNVLARKAFHVRSVNHLEVDLLLLPVEIMLRVLLQDPFVGLAARNRYVFRTS